MIKGMKKECQTQRVLLAPNVANIRDGDSNFHQNSLQNQQSLDMIEGTTLADAIHCNSNRPWSLDDVRDDVRVHKSGLAFTSSYKIIIS